ncbi:MAG: hypothetical protein ACK5WP_09360 [Neisseriaceae bacterium]
MLKTKNDKLLSVTEITFDNLIEAIASTNPSLSLALAKLDDDNEYTFYKASYRFGDKIINNGKCYLPLADGGTISFDNEALPDKLKDDLSFKKDNHEDPLGFVVSRTSEFYLPGNDGVQPNKLINPGSIFGIARATDDVASETSTSVLELNLNAGARSLFMLSKISDKTRHVRLQKEYGILTPPPLSPQEHWNIFVEIANATNSEWRCEIIYFPRAWINKLKTDDWALLSNKLLSLHRSSYNILHRSSEIWKKAFDEIDHEKKLTYYNPQSLTIAKQLFVLAANAGAGFRPATNDDSAPIGLLTKVYNEVYNRNEEDKNSAVIMEPSKLNVNDNNPIYYSINYSPFSQENLQASNKRSQISLLEDVRRITEYYSTAILETKSNVQSLYNTAQNARFSFYHTDPDNYPKIHNSKIVPESDPRFIDGLQGDFPSSSTFFRGCIRVTRNG